MYEEEDAGTYNCKTNANNTLHKGHFLFYRFWFLFLIECEQQCCNDIFDIKSGYLM